MNIKYLLGFACLAIGLIVLSSSKFLSSDDKTEVKVEDKKEMHEGYHIGDMVDDFNLKNIDGNMISLDSFENVKGYVITFTCNHCPYAVMYEDRLVALHQMYEPMGFPIIAINPNDPEVVPEDSFEAMQARAKEKAFPFVYLFDEGQKVFPVFGATKTPHVYLLDAERIVKYIGAIDDSPRDEAAVEEKYLENAINALQIGKSPSPETTKAIGCSIKVKK